MLIELFEPQYKRKVYKIDYSSLYPLSLAIPSEADKKDIALSCARALRKLITRALFGS